MADKPKYPVTVQLSGTDGNAFALISKVSRALRGYLYDNTSNTPAEVRNELDKFQAEAMAGDYDHLLRTCMKWVEVE